MVGILLSEPSLCVWEVALDRAWSGFCAIVELVYMLFGGEPLLTWAVFSGASLMASCSKSSV